MNNDALLQKLAEGLYCSALEHKVVSIYREDLKFFCWNLDKNPFYFKFLKSPFVDYKDKCGSLDDIFGDAFVDGVLAFIKILITKELIGDINKIRKIFNKLADDDANVVEGIIYTPYSLTKEQIFKISLAFSKKLRKEVILKEAKDTSLIAGVKVILDGTIYEYSINSQLESVKESLLKKIDKEGI